MGVGLRGQTHEQGDDDAEAGADLGKAAQGATVLGGGNLAGGRNRRKGLRCGMGLREVWGRWAGWGKGGEGGEGGMGWVGGEWRVESGEWGGGGTRNQATGSRYASGKEGFIDNSHDSAHDFSIFS